MPAGTTVFDAASWNGIAIDSTCGGHGTCKKCKVRVVSGGVPIDTVDPRAFSDRRAARRVAAGVPRGRRRGPRDRRAAAADAAEGGAGRRGPPRHPAARRCRSAHRRWRSRRSRIRPRTSSGSGRRRRHRARVHPAAARTLGRTLRASNFDVTAVVCDELLIDVEPGDTTADRHAISFDLGTTTVVAKLLDLATGQPLAVRSMLNRQQPFGADVISRVSATMLDPDALEALQARAAETLNLLAAEVCAEAGVERERVYEMVLCGNVTMTQIALGIDPEPLAVAPFIIDRAAPARRHGRRLRRPHPPARARVRLPGARRLRRRRHHRGDARDRPHPRPAAAALHRRRHQLRDRARVERAGGRDGRTGRARLRGGPDPVRDAGGRGRDRGRQHRGRRPRPGGDRRRRPGRHVRVGPRRRRRAARLRAACSTTRAGSSPTRTRPRRIRGWLRGS